VVEDPRRKDMDNEAAKKIVQKIENQRRKAEAMERVA
jgi:hypothetical protein